MKNQEQIYLEQLNEWLIIKGFTKSTVNGLVATVTHFINWTTDQNIAAENVSYNDVLAYINDKRKQGNKPRTLLIITNALNHFYKFLQSEHELAENPVTNIKIKGVKRKVLQEILTPEELEKIYKSYQTKKVKNSSAQKHRELARKRNKIILSLIIYQGIRTAELAKLEIQDLQLREGKINIQSSKRTGGRILKLEAHQIYDLMDYVHTIRKEILASTSKQTNKVFISVGSSLNFSNVMQKLIKTVKSQHPKLQDTKQLRSSVITNWLKVHNLRKTQYMAGHKYVSSTEAYQINNIDELQEDIKKYHPIG